VELTAFDGAAATATVYAAQPRFSPPEVRVLARTAYTLALHVDWLSGAPPPEMRFYTVADRPRRLEPMKRATQSRTAIDGFEFTVPRVRDLVYAILTGPSGEFLYATKFSEQRGVPVPIGCGASDQPLIDAVLRPIAGAPSTLAWPRESRKRFEAIRKIGGSSLVAHMGKLGEKRDADVTLAYRIVLLKHFGIEADSSVLADMNRDDFRDALSLLLSGIDVRKWSTEDIVWAMKRRSSASFRPVMTAYPDAKEARRAFDIWEQLQTACRLLDRFTADAIGRGEMSSFKREAEAYIRTGRSKPDASRIGVWKERLDLEDQGLPLSEGDVHQSEEARKAAEANARLETVWLSRLGNLLVEWTTGKREQRSFDPSEIEMLLHQIEKPPASSPGKSDSWMTDEARALKESAVLHHETLVGEALQKLQSVIIPYADDCARFHSFVGDADVLAGAHAVLRDEFPLHRSLPTETLQENAKSVTRLVQEAEAKASSFPRIERRLGRNELLRALLEPNHSAMMRLCDELRSDVSHYELSLAIPEFSPGEASFENALSQWWEHLTMLERTIRDAEEQMERLQSIAAATWRRLEPLLVPAMSALRAASAGRAWVVALDPLVQQASHGDPHAPRRICEILAAHPDWSKSLEDGVSKERSYGRK
jgi:hypothetical protein